MDKITVAMDAAKRVFSEYGDPTALFSTNYKMFVTACNTPPEKMTRSDARRLQANGWVWDARLDCWTLSVKP